MVIKKNIHAHKLFKIKCFTNELIFRMSCVKSFIQIFWKFKILAGITCLE